ncbi:MAG: hypothetical protein RLZZ237_242, partial [Pseudomonadota bacterium]
MQMPHFPETDMASIVSRAKPVLAVITMALCCGTALAAPADAGITIGSKIDTEASLLCP